MKTDKKIIGLVVVTALIFLFWNSALLYPLRILSVFFHEASHAIVARMGQGIVKEMHIDRLEGGHVLAAGGNSFLIYNAGYLGNLIIGNLILIVAYRTRYDRALCIAIGLGMFTLIALYIRDRWGVLMSVALGSVFVIFGAKAKEAVCEGLLIVVGMHSSLYPLYDIYSDVILRSSERSDGWYLAQATHIPVLVWGFLWLLLAVLSSWFTFRLILRSGKFAA